MGPNQDLFSHFKFDKDHITHILKGIEQKGSGNRYVCFHQISIHPPDFILGE